MGPESGFLSPSVAGSGLHGVGCVGLADISPCARGKVDICGVSVRGTEVCKVGGLIGVVFEGASCFWDNDPNDGVLAPVDQEMAGPLLEPPGVGFLGREGTA